MRWWPRKPAPPDATPFIEEDPALETSPRTTRCARPDCFNNLPPDRERFCSDECLKAYSVSVMGKIRGLRTLRATPIRGAAQDDAPRGGEEMDQFKCGKCGKTSAKPGMC